MSVELDNFDATQVPESQFDPLPEGQYTVCIVKSERKVTKDGQGQFISLEFEIVDGPKKGRKHFENLNLVNKNETAVAMAKRALADICIACDNPRPKSTGELHNIPFKIDVKCVKNDKTGDIQNRVKKYISLTGVSHHTPATTGATPAPPVQADENVPPWARKA